MDTFSSATLFHIVRKQDWLSGEDKPYYKPESLEKEGFIHLSTREQVIETARVYYKGAMDLLLLEVEISHADPVLKWESVPRSETAFPHYYGELPRTFVKKVYHFKPNHIGDFTFPSEP
ncbi:MAG: DUF952 domain-containing protein [Bacteroidota bacterium]